MKTPRLNYQLQDSPLTLEEALQEYRDANPHLFNASGFSSETSEFFRCHDRIHVVFGCDTSFADEAKADLWTMMGTDVGIKNYLKLATSPVVKDLYQDVKGKRTDESRAQLRREIARSIAQAFLAPLKIFLRSRKMQQKWPWSENDQFLNRPLREIRKQFGIKIL